jgi:hypothetical protein
MDADPGVQVRGCRDEFATSLPPIGRTAMHRAQAGAASGRQAAVVQAVRADGRLHDAGKSIRPPTERTGVMMAGLVTFYVVVVILATMLIHYALSHTR